MAIITGDIVYSFFKDEEGRMKTFSTLFFLKIDLDISKFIYRFTHYTMTKTKIMRIKGDEYNCEAHHLRLNVDST